MPLRLQFSQLLNVSCRFVFHIFTILLPWRRFPILNLAFFMKIFSVRQTVLPALLVLSPVVFAADEQTMIVSAAPQVVSELDTPAAVSVVDGEEMRLATPRINLSESLTSVPGLQVQTGRTMRKIYSCRFADLAPAPLTEFAVFACMWTVFPPPCPTDKGKHPTSI